MNICWSLVCVCACACVPKHKQTCTHATRKHATAASSRANAPTRTTSIIINIIHHQHHARIPHLRRRRRPVDDCCTHALLCAIRRAHARARLPSVRFERDLVRSMAVWYMYIYAACVCVCNASCACVCVCTRRRQIKQEELKLFQEYRFQVHEIRNRKRADRARERQIICVCRGFFLLFFVEHMMMLLLLVHRRSHFLCSRELCLNQIQKKNKKKKSECLLYARQRWRAQIAGHTRGHILFVVCLCRTRARAFARVVLCRCC